MKIHTFHPTNIGYTPTGTANGSQIFLGKDIYSEFEGVGFGPNARPDTVERIVMNLTKIDEETPRKIAKINFDATGLAYIIDRGLYTPETPNFELKEILVCEDGETKNMMILASQTYPTGWKPGY